MGNHIRAKAGRFAKYRRAAILVFMAACLMGGGGRPANALLITTEFVFIGPNQGVGAFVMKNTAGERRAFRMNWVEVAMSPDGRRILLDSTEAAQMVPGLMPASPYVYMAPRRMMIESTQVQSIRFMARRPQNMPPGEYRSYLEIKPEEMPDTFQGVDVEIPSGQRNVELSMKMLTGLRVPVFVLNGDTTLNVSLENPEISRDAQGKLTLSYTFVREGTRSALGTVDLRCQREDGREKFVGRYSIKVFTEVQQRNFTSIVPEEALAECVSPLVLNFTPHKDDPAYNGQPIASVAVPR